VKGLIWRAAKSNNEKEFNDSMSLIKNENKDVYDYLMNIDSKKWALWNSPLIRFGIVTSNNAESLNSWMGSLRDKSHLEILNGFVMKSAELVFKRFEEIRIENEIILSYVMTSKIKPKLKEGIKGKIRKFDEQYFSIEYENGMNYRTIDLVSKTCSCGEMKIFGIPCKHMAAVIVSEKLNFPDFVHPSYRTDTISALYNWRLFPVDPETLISDGQTKPPLVLKKVGRPKKRRIRSRGEVSEEDKVTCSKCNQRGHNIRTCVNKLTPIITDNVIENCTQEIINRNSRKKRKVFCSICGGNHYRKTQCHS